MLIGNKSKLAFDITGVIDGGLHEIDIWANDTLITYYDNKTYLPAFLHRLELELSTLESGVFAEEYVFLNYGPTTDDAVSRIKRIGEEVMISISLEKGEIFEIKTDLNYLVGAYKKVIGALSGENT